MVTAAAPNVALAATDDNRFNTYYTLSAGALLAAGWMPGMRKGRLLRLRWR